MANNNADNTETTFPVEKNGNYKHILYPVLFIFLHMMVLLLAVLIIASADVIKDLPEEAMSQGDIFELLSQSLLNSNVNNKGALLMSLIMIPSCLYFLHRRKLQYPQVFSLQPISRKSLGKTFLAIFSAQALAMLWLVFLDWLRDYWESVDRALTQYEGLMQTLISEDLNVWLLVITTSVLVPLVEELVYRGVVMGEFRALMKPRLALFLQALIFGLVHGNITQGVYAFLMALVIGVIYLKGENIWLCVFAHMIFNFFGGALPQILGEESQFMLGLRYVQFGILAASVVYIIYLAVQNPAKLKASWQ